MFSTKIPTKIILLLTALFSFSSSFAVIKIATTGTWEAAATWSPSGKPASGDVAIIPDLVTVTITGNNYNGAPAALSIIVGTDDGDADGGNLTFGGSSQLNLTAASLLTFYANSFMSSSGPSNSDQLQFGTGGSHVTFKGADLNFAGPGIFGIGGGIGTVLPITIGTFKIMENDTYNTVSWTTLTEIDNDYFTVEHSLDLENWNSLATINGQGNSNVEISYFYEDYNVSSEIVYYRIKQTDYDGTFSYSEIRATKTSDKSSFSIFPNPFITSFIIEGEEFSKELIFIRDLNGNSMMDNVEMIELSNNQVQVITNNSAKSVFLISLGSETLSVIKK